MKDLLNCLTTLDDDEEVIFHLREKLLSKWRLIQDCHVCNNCKNFRLHFVS